MYSVYVFEHGNYDNMAFSELKTNQLSSERLLNKSKNLK